MIVMLDGNHYYRNKLGWWRVLEDNVNVAPVSSVSTAALDEIVHLQAEIEKLQDQIKDKWNLYLIVIGELNRLQKHVAELETEEIKHDN